MKAKITTIKILFIAVVSFPMAVVSQNNAKTTVAVLNIESKGVILDAESLGSIVRLELEKTKVYTVFDRIDIADVLKKNNMDMSTCLAKSCLLEAGRVLHADKIISGSVERFGEQIAITLKVIDTERGEIEKSNTTEFLNLQKEIQKMLEISIKKLVGIDPDKDMTDVLVNYNQPIQSALTTVNLSGPRAGICFTDGIMGERMRADKLPYGGLGMYKITSVIGWQQEVQYLSSGNYQGLIEFIFTGSGLESGRFIPAFTFLNGFRLNRQGWEIAFGPTFRFVRKADGFYDKLNLLGNGSDKWYLVSQWPNDKGPNFYQENGLIVSNLDDRGTPSLSAGLVIGVGKTFKSGYLNIPVNIYIIPRKEGTVYGMSFGFNVFKSSSHSR